jgi:hypothetical protein
MSPRLPTVPGRQVVRALERIGYRLVRHESNPDHLPITISYYNKPVPSWVACALIELWPAADRP